MHAFDLFGAFGVAALQPLVHRVQVVGQHAGAVLALGGQLLGGQALEDLHVLHLLCGQLRQGAGDLGAGLLVLDTQNAEPGYVKQLFAQLNIAGGEENAG